MMTFANIADAYLRELGYEPDESKGEDEARQKAQNWISADKSYPVYYFKTETTGEKLYEELLTTEENTIPTYHDKIMIAKTENINVVNVRAKIEALISSPKQSYVEIVKGLKSIVPEYVSNNSEYEVLDGDKVKIKKLKIG